MRWEDEAYVKVYTRDTIDWQALSIEAQGLWLILLRKFDRAGILHLGKHGKRGILIAAGHPSKWPAYESAVDELLRDGCLVIEGALAVSPNFIEAQAARSSEIARKRAQRERDRDRAMASGLASAGTGTREVDALMAQQRAAERVSPSASESQNVTPSHSTADPVTQSVTRVTLSTAKLSSAQLNKDSSVLFPPADVGGEPPPRPDAPLGPLASPPPDATLGTPFIDPEPTSALPGPIPEVSTPPDEPAPEEVEEDAYPETPAGKRNGQPGKETASQELPLGDKSAAQRVFDHWRLTWRVNGNARMDKERKGAIEKALSRYSLEEVCRSITGWRNDPWEDRKNHATPEVLLSINKDRNNVERGMAMAESGKPPPSPNRHMRAEEIPKEAHVVTRIPPLKKVASNTTGGS